MWLHYLNRFYFVLHGIVHNILNMIVVVVAVVVGSGVQTVMYITHVSIWLMIFHFIHLKRIPGNHTLIWPFVFCLISKLSWEQHNRNGMNQLWSTKLMRTRGTFVFVFSIDDKHKFSEWCSVYLGFRLFLKLFFPKKNSDSISN